MDFNTLINEKIMPEVKSDSDEPIIIYRDKYGNWHGDFTRNQYGEEFDWVDDVRENNLFAITVTGSDFYKKSYQAVYDEIILGQLRAEYDLFYETGTVIGLPYALISFVEDNISELPQEITDYLMELERPFAALIEMIPQDLKNNLNVNFPNLEIQDKLIDHIEKEVEKRRNNQKTTNHENEQNTALPVIDMKKLESVLHSGGFSNDEVQAIWHTVWDYSGDWLKVFDERFMKAADVKNDVPVVTDKSEIDISAQKPKKQKPSLSERIEKGKEKVREADKNKPKSDKPKKHDKGVDD